MSTSSTPVAKESDPSEPERVISLDELLAQDEQDYKLSFKTITPAQPTQAQPVPEIGGRTDGPEPTRYGDWEKNGRCIDF